MTNLEGTPETPFKARFRPARGWAGAAAGQLALLLLLLICSRTFAQNKPGSDYIRSSQPPLLNYKELVALGEQETVDPTLAEKLNTLLTTPFVNNEAYFAEQNLFVPISRAWDPRCGSSNGTSRGVSSSTRSGCR